MYKLLVIALILITGAAAALPSYLGLRGLNRTVDAKPIGAGEFSIGIFTFLGVSPDARFSNLSGEPVAVTDTEFDGTGILNLGIGLGDKVEIAGGVSYVWNSLTRGDEDARIDAAGESESISGLSEASLAMKFSGNPGGGDFWWGIMPWASFGIFDEENPVLVNEGGYDGVWRDGEPMFEMRRAMLGTDLSVGGDLLLSLELSPTLRLHTNLGYHFYRQSFQYTDYRYGTNDSVEVDITVDDPALHLAFGAEMPLRYAILFAEAEWTRLLDRDAEGGDGERYDDMISISPGLRIPTKSGFAFDIVGSFAMHNFDTEWSDLGHSVYQAEGTEPSDDLRADHAPFPGGYPARWGVGVNLMYSSDIAAPGTGLLSGTVTDAVTGERLAATVAFPGTAVEPVMSNGETGFYSAELPEGSVAVTVNSPGYIGAGATLQVEGGVDITRDYALQPEQGTITGTITDLNTGLPIRGATVSVGQESDVTESDGLYSLSISGGTRTVTATAAGYLSTERQTNVIAGESVMLDIQLRPALVEGQVLSFNDIYFDFDSSNIKPESYSILDSIVAMFIEDADVRIQIAGHTDSDGSNEYNQGLSERRAQSVFSYLVDHGVSASRLTTVGYGESQPVVPNTSDANKAQNRRIEFTVLGR